MAAFALRAESARFNPRPLPEARPPRRAQIEALVQRLIDALDLVDELDGYEDDDEDCCEALDDTGGMGFACEAFGFYAPGDPDDAEDGGDPDDAEDGGDTEDDDGDEVDDEREHDSRGLPVVFSPCDYSLGGVVARGASRHAG